MASSVGRSDRGTPQRLQRYKLIFIEPNRELIGSGCGGNSNTINEKLQQKNPPKGWAGGVKSRGAAVFFTFN